MDKAHLTYRPCVGIFLLNGQARASAHDNKKIWQGKRDAHTLVDAHLFEEKHLWQMPQGGIDEGETPQEALRRELYEETGITQFEILAQHPRWLTYDLPDHLIGKALKGGFRGQRQQWFAIKFLGEDDQINLNADTTPEFTAWRWASLDEVLDQVVPFKQEIYKEVCAHFAPLMD